MVKKAQKLQYSDLETKVFAYDASTKVESDVLLKNQDNLIATLDLFMQKQCKLSSSNVYIYCSQELIIPELLEFYFSKNINLINQSVLVKDKSKDSCCYSWVAEDEYCSNHEVVLKQKPYGFFDDVVLSEIIFGSYSSDKDEESKLILGEILKYRILVFDTNKLIKFKYIMERLIRSLDCGYITLGENLIKIPLNISVVMIGDVCLQDSLESFNDYTINKVFDFCVEPKEEINFSEETINDYCDLINYSASKLGFSLEGDSYPLLVLHSNSICEDNTKLTLHRSELNTMIEHSSLFSKTKYLTRQNFKDLSSYQELLYREMSDEFLSEYFLDYVKVCTSSSVVGQINSLAIIESGNKFYGIPSRLTANVYHGDGEIIHIDKKSDLSGNIHTKSTYIINSALHNMMDTCSEFDISGNITFEQSYSEIDGDSATSAEFCVLLSAISNIPLKQSIGVTGSMDQFGGIQCVGGVNEKIIGFYNLCSKRGLDGTHGVVIPASNKNNLFLPDYILNDIKNEKFTIYTASHIDEVVSIVTGMDCGEKDDGGIYTPDSVYGVTQEKLLNINSKEKGFFAKLLGFFKGA